MVIKGVHANTSARIDSVTSAVITNELRRKSNEWVFYEFRGDRSRKERKTRRTVEVRERKTTRREELGVTASHCGLNIRELNY